MKNRHIAIFLLILLISSIAAVPLLPVEVEAEEPEEDPSTVAEIWGPPIVFEEFPSFIRLNFTMFAVDFYKDTAGYNVIYNSTGDVVVYEERQVLEYWAGSQWKQRGVPVDLSWVKVSDYQYNVTRHYMDWADTWYNVTFVVRSDSAIKSVISIDSGQTDEYRLLWQMTGIVHDAWDKTGNRLVFGNEEFDYGWIGFDWEDVYEILGDITETSVETSVQGKKADIYFNLGTIISGQNLVVDPSTVTTSSALGYATGLRRGEFYAEGRYWVFFYQSSNLYFRTSTDGISWSGSTAVRGITTWCWDVFFDGTYVHYVAASNNDDGKDTYYRRGNPNADGSITWSAVEQKAVDFPSTGHGRYQTIAVDTNGYVYISYTYSSYSQLGSVSVARSGNNDGTWGTGTTESIDSGTGDYSCGHRLLQLTDGKMYIVYQFTEDQDDNYHGKLWGGSSWGGREDIAPERCSPLAFSAVADGDDVYFVWKGGSPYYRIYMKKRTYGTGWGSTETVQGDTLPDDSYSFPALSIDEVTGDLYCFRGHSDNHIYYNKRTTAWGSQVNWIDESTDTLSGGVGCYDKVYSGVFNDKLGVVYRTSISPYNLRFYYLQFRSVLTITSASITNMDDGDNIYTMKDGWYNLQAVVNHLDGATSISKVYVQIKNGEAVVGEFRATSLTGTPAWAIQTGTEIFDLDAGSCSWNENGNEGTATFKIRAEWDITQYDNLEIEVYVQDAAAYSVGWTVMQMNYVDIINRLVTTDFAASDGRVNKGDAVTLSGSVQYATTTSGNTPSSIAPPDAQFTAVRIHNSTHDVMESDTSISSGAFSIGSFNIPDAVQSNSYHVYLDLVVDYTDGDAPDGDIVSVIGDRWKLLTFGVSDDNPKIGENVYFNATAELEYDGHAPDGEDILVIEGEEFTWDWENEWFYAEVNKSTEGAITYDTLTSIEEYSYDITLGTMNGLSVTVTWGYHEFHFYGLFSENGSFAEAINMSAHMPTQTEIFEVDGYQYKAFTEEPEMFSFSLLEGGNRYIYKLQDNETIYLFTPDETYSVYSFTIRDYTGQVGQGATYLESLRVVNGTERMVERQIIWDTANAVPLTLVQSQIYALQVRFSDNSTYRFGYWIPGAEGTPTLSIYDIAFSDQAHIATEHITVEAQRPADTHIRVNYKDELDDTEEVFVEVCLTNGTQVWNDTGAGDMLQFNWYGADNETDYMIQVEMTHGFYGELTYTCWLAGAQAAFEDPFDLTLFGDWPITGAFAVFIIIGTACLFSRGSAVIGMGATVLVAAALAGIGWIAINYTVLAICFALVVMMGLGGAK